MSILSREEVLQVVANRFGKPFELKCFETQKLSVQGMMGEFFRLCCSITVDGQKEREEKFFIKRKSTAPSLEKAAIEVFKKERANYQLFIEMDSPLLNEVIAKCCFVNEDNLVFCDQTQEGYVQEDGQREPTLDEVKLLLKTLAALHACAIIFEEQKSRQLGRPYFLSEDRSDVINEYYFGELNNTLGVSFMNAMIKGLVGLADMYDIEDTLKNGKSFRQEMWKLANIGESVRSTATKFRNVLCHCDLWAANIFVLRRNGEPVHMRLIDFQMTRYKPPAHDVLSALYLHTSRAFRHAHQDLLLETYYNYFGNYLKESNIDVETICSFDDFMQSCREERLIATFNECNTMPLVLLDKQDLNEFYASKDGRRWFLEDRSVIYKRYKKTDFYHIRCKDALMDLKDLINDGLLP